MLLQGDKRAKKSELICNWQVRTNVLYIVNLNWNS